MTQAKFDILFGERILQMGRIQGKILEFQRLHCQFLYLLYDYLHLIKKVLRDTHLSKQFKSINSGPRKLDTLKFEENWASSLSSKFQRVI